MNKKKDRWEDHKASEGVTISTKHDSTIHTTPYSGGVLVMLTSGEMTDTEKLIQENILKSLKGIEL